MMFSPNKGCVYWVQNFVEAESNLNMSNAMWLNQMAKCLVPDIFIIV